LTAAMGVGSVAGALAAGARGRVTPRLIVAASMIFGVSELFVAAAPTLPIQLLFLVPLGAASVTFAAGINSSLQIAVEPAMRGRVMALYSVVFLGSTPIGSPLVGWLAGVAGPRAGLLAGAIAALIAAVGARYAYGRLAARAAPASVAGEPAAASPEPAPISARARAHAGRVRTRLSSAVARERA
jgi:Transmembrane secretion effector